MIHHLRRTMPTAVTLAVGIAANVLVISIAYCLLYAPPGLVQDPNALWILEVTRSEQRGVANLAVSGSEFQQLRAAAPQIVQLTAFGSYSGNVRADGAAGRAKRATVVAATPEYWSVMRPLSIEGRVFDDGDTAGNSLVAVVNERLAGAVDDQTVKVGKSINVDGLWVTIIGILPRQFQGTQSRPVDLWLPVAQAGLGPSDDARAFLDPEAVTLNVAGRILPGHREQDASVRLRGALGPQATVRLRRPEHVTGGDRLAVTVLSGVLQFAAALLAIIAMFNAAGLTLVSNLRRRRELAIRIAVGCTDGGLVRLLLLDSLLLSLIVLILAVPMASVALKLFFWAVADDSVRDLFARVTSLELPVMFVAAGLSTFLSVASSLAPAAWIAKLASTRTTQIINSTAPAGHRGSRHNLISVQTSLAVALLLVAGLLMRTSYDVRGTPAGMDTAGVRFAQVQSSSSGYDDDKTVELQSRLQTSLSSSPMLSGVALSRQAPLQPNGWVVQVEGVPRVEERGIKAGFNVVSPNYFEFLGIALLSGRSFHLADDSSAPPVAIVNRMLSDRLWGTDARQGRSILIAGESIPREVVGVVANTKYTGLRRATEPYLFLPISQKHRGAALEFTILTRPNGGAVAADSLVVNAVHDLDPNLAVSRFASVSEQTDRELRLQHLLLSVVSVTGLAALALVAMGFQCVLSQEGDAMRKEMGIRLALGATYPGLCLLLARRLGRGLTIGIVSGWLLGALAGAALSKLLVGSGVVDIVVGAGVLTCLGISVAIPVAHQCWRLARLLPSDALRLEG